MSLFISLDHPHGEILNPAERRRARANGKCELNKGFLVCLFIYLFIYLLRLATITDLPQHTGSEHKYSFPKRPI